MSITVNQFGGRCPHISFLKGGGANVRGGGGHVLLSVCLAVMTSGMVVK